MLWIITIWCSTKLRPTPPSCFHNFLVFTKGWSFSKKKSVNWRKKKARAFHIPCYLSSPCGSDVKVNSRWRHCLQVFIMRAQNKRKLIIKKRVGTILLFKRCLSNWYNLYWNKTVNVCKGKEKFKHNKQNLKFFMYDIHLLVTEYFLFFQNSYFIIWANLRA